MTHPGHDTESGFAVQLQRVVRSARWGAMLLARSIPPDKIDKGFLHLKGKGGSGNYAITAAASAPAEVDSTLLKGTIVVSGLRPVRVTVALTAISPAGSHLVCWVRWDGVDQPQRLFYLDGADNESVSGFVIIEGPAPGEHTVSLSAAVGSGTGTIYSDDPNPLENNAVMLVAEEL